jgi:A/G-specific adenine glycosylase
MEVVVPRFLRFLERFPDIVSLARAREDEVVAEWSGLGYYRRARALHAAARKVVQEHAGEFPRDLAQARALPGIGRYTAGAILSIAYNLPAPVLDGNVGRVLSRVFRIGGEVGRGAAERLLWDLAARLIPAGRAREFNQALMELGALVCLPRAPLCGECPLAERCEARRAGDPERYPEQRHSPRHREVELALAVVQRGRSYLLVRRGEEGPSYLRGLWGFPTLEASLTEGAAALGRDLRERWGLDTRPGERLGTFRHSITFRKITAHAFRLEPRGAIHRVAGKEPEGSRVAWAGLDRLGPELATSSLSLKVKAAILKS